MGVQTETAAGFVVTP